VKEDEKLFHSESFLFFLFSNGKRNENAELKFLLQTLNAHSQLILLFNNTERKGNFKIWNFSFIIILNFPPVVNFVLEKLNEL
jgi:hypothetical protein